jgi:hypothetical protein
MNKEIIITPEMLKEGQLALGRAWNEVTYGLEPYDPQLLAAIYIAMESERQRQVCQQHQESH